MNIKKMSIGLLAVLLTVPAFAQTQQDSIKQVIRPENMMLKKTMLLTAGTLMMGIWRDSQVKKVMQKKTQKTALALEKAALLAAVQAKQAQEADSLPTCVYCGEQFNPALHEHCSAQGYAGICSPTKNDCKAPKSSAPASRCPKCGEELTIDERYHGVEHHCKDNAQTTAQKPVCAYCGEEITSQGQHCSAQNYISLCSQSKKHQRKVKSETPASRCPKCGKKLTIDERYHGVEHVCRANVAAQPAEYCIYCGKEIKTSNQECSAGQGVCRTHCPECCINLRDPNNISADGVHHCRFKQQIKPVPVKK